MQKQSWSRFGEATIYGFFKTNCGSSKTPLLKYSLRSSARTRDNNVPYYKQQAA
jgi:hypothetical protein